MATEDATGIHPEKSQKPDPKPIDERLQKTLDKALYAGGSEAAQKVRNFLKWHVAWRAAACRSHRCADRRLDDSAPLRRLGTAHRSSRICSGRGRLNRNRTGWGSRCGSGGRGRLVRR